MSEHPNAAVIRQQTDAMNRGEMQAMADALADDVIWHEIGSPEPVRGKAAVADRWSGMGDNDTTFRVELHDVVANDDHAVALVTATVTSGGRSFSYRTAEIYHMRDGKVTERWAFSDDTAAITAFFGS